MGFYLVPFRQPNPPTRFLSITGHWNVSLPSGASPWNGMFDRVEGQYRTFLQLHVELSQLQNLTFFFTKQTKSWVDLNVYSFIGCVPGKLQSQSWILNFEKKKYSHRHRSYSLPCSPFQNYQEHVTIYEVTVKQCQLRTSISVSWLIIESILM